MFKFMGIPFVGIIVAALFMMASAASAAPAEMYLPQQSCQSNGLVSVPLRWGNASSGTQRVDVSLNSSFVGASSGYTTVGEIVLVDAKPGTTYYIRVVDQATSPTFVVTAGICGASAPAPADVSGLAGNCYEGQWQATAANSRNAEGTPVGTSVIVIESLDPVLVSYSFNGTSLPNNVWKVVDGEIWSVNDAIRFKPQGNALLGEIESPVGSGTITSVGAFTRC